MKSIKSQLNALIHLAAVDGYSSPVEKMHIKTLGKAHGISEKEIDDLIDNPDTSLSNMENLSEDEKFDFLFNIVQLMKVDNRVFRSEVKYCEQIAVKLGFSKDVISTLSSRIYSDPSITTDLESLRKEVMKYSRKK